MPSEKQPKTISIKAMINGPEPKMRARLEKMKQLGNVAEKILRLHQDGKPLIEAIIDVVG